MIYKKHQSYLCPEVKVIHLNLEPVLGAMTSFEGGHNDTEEDEWEADEEQTNGAKSSHFQEETGINK